MKLEKKSIEWAITHIKNHKDTDLFPNLKEYDILFLDENYLIDKLSNIDVENYVWQSYRRFIIPKDEYSYRAAIQLDPVDNLLIVALTYQYGNLIEQKRISVDQNKVFNYRFYPTDTGNLYNKKNAWKNFWNQSKKKIQEFNYAVYIDIADFYNRIYHHTLENQLIDCEFPNPVIKAIKNMLQNTTQITSQGIPVGPYAMHIFAEMCLIPVDESLIMKGYEYCRYSDDIIIFVNSKSEGQIVIYEMAKVLDSLKLNMQRHKTKIFDRIEFQKHCDNMLDDNPINDLECEMINIINEYSSDPYSSIGFSNISDVDREVFSEDRIEKILMNYLNENKDYQRIRWLFRRLSNVGVDTAVNLVVREIDNLMPAISDIALYFASIAEESNMILHETGEKLLDLVNNPIMKSNEFFELTIFNLFANTNKFDNIHRLVGFYSNSSDHIKRELIFAGYSAEKTAWIRELKQDYSSLSEWTKRALLIASSLLPRDERKFFIQSVIQGDSSLTTEIIAKNIKNM